uniref:B-cell translocation gene 3 n=1 Tax=Neolamprologus brichardi TaxID=32507 RepID=A0A3Q4HSW3_NEOBR
MRREIAAVVFFLKRLVKKGEKLEAEKVELFVERLAVALQEKFKGHWYPENPSKGQAYRCIRVNRFHKQDPELLRACRESGIQYSDLGLPRELTLWVDPGEYNNIELKETNEQSKTKRKRATTTTNNFHVQKGAGRSISLFNPTPFPLSSSQ